LGRHIENSTALKAQALRGNHDSLVVIRASRTHRRAAAFKGWIIVQLAAANTPEHYHDFFQGCLQAGNGKQKEKTQP
jgi:hypothetical protein